MRLKIPFLTRKTTVFFQQKITTNSNLYKYYFVGIFYQYKHFGTDFKVFWDPEIWHRGQIRGWKSQFWLGKNWVFFQQKITYNFNKYKFNFVGIFYQYKHVGTDFIVFWDPEYY